MDFRTHLIGQKLEKQIRTLDDFDLWHLPIFKIDGISIVHKKMKTKFFNIFEFQLVRTFKASPEQRFGDPHLAAIHNFVWRGRRIPVPECSSSVPPAIHYYFRPGSKFHGSCS